MTPNLGRWEQEIDELLAEIEQRLKKPEVALSLGERGVNASIALIATQGLRAYVRGNKAEAAEDLATAADELDARLQFAKRKSERPS